MYKEIGKGQIIDDCKICPGKKIVALRRETDEILLDIYFSMYITIPHNFEIS